MCLALPPFAAPGSSSLPQTEYVDRHLDEERQADAQHYCTGNEPSESRDDGRKCCGSSCVPAFQPDTPGASIGAINGASSCASNSKLLGDPRERT
jgi:hypothetical protein